MEYYSHHNIDMILVLRGYEVALRLHLLGVGTKIAVFAVQH